MRKELVKELKEFLEEFSEKLELHESLELEKGIKIEHKSSNYPNYLVKIIDNKKEKI